MKTNKRMSVRVAVFDYSLTFVEGFCTRDLLLPKLVSGELDVNELEVAVNEYENE
jgi:hypothetical protein